MFYWTKSGTRYGDTEKIFIHTSSRLTISLNGIESESEILNNLFLDNKFRILSGSFLSRVFISLVTGAFLGFLFSFLLIYNGNISGSNEDFGISFLNIRNSNQVSTGDGDLVDYLYNDVRILCIVMTEPDAVEQRTQFIKETWGKRCNKLIHISTKPGEFQSLPTFSQKFSRIPHEIKSLS